MSYRESRRCCKTCGRETLHWRPWFDLRPAFHHDGWRGILRAMLHPSRLLIFGHWRCVECDHPWSVSLLRR